MKPPPIVQRVDSLEELAVRINAEFAVAEQGQRQAIAAYRKIGQALIDAKAMCSHGEWLPWLKANVPFSEFQARRYIRLAKSVVTTDLEAQWQIIQGNAEPEGAPDDSLREPPPSLLTEPDIREIADRLLAAAEAEVSAYSPEENEHLANAYLANRTPPEAIHNHRAQGTGVNEWYTPPDILDIARATLGGFDLDPASSDTAQATVQAAAHFTQDDDGLAKEWHGRVWLNPPYSQPAITQFVEKLVAEYQAGRVTEAILLTHNYTDTSWFHAAAASCSAVCFTRGRIAFLSPTGEKAAPTQGQAFTYFGPNVKRFREGFAALGLVLTRGQSRGH